MDFNDYPIGRILDEIRHSLGGNLFQMALGMTLTLPDICVALAADNGRSGDKIKYRRWCEDNFLASYPNLDGGTLFGMRCGIIHQGKIQHPSLAWDRIIWTSPRLSGIVLHNTISAYGVDGQDVLYLCIEQFCADMTIAVLTWYDQHRSDPNVLKNVPDLIRIHQAME